MSEEKLTFVFYSFKDQLDLVDNLIKVVYERSPLTEAEVQLAMLTAVKRYLLSRSMTLNELRESGAKEEVKAFVELFHSALAVLEVNDKETYAVGCVEIIKHLGGFDVLLA